MRGVRLLPRILGAAGGVCRRGSVAVRSVLALGWGVAVCVGGVGTANAQTVAQTTAAATPIEKIEVTGSAIRRTDVETPSPVQVITSEELKRSGYTDVSDVLRNVAANGAGSLSQSFNFAFAGGASGVALRGLAVGDTLVLIDGHRTAPYPISDDNQRSFTDVSNIPFEAIDHIEILRDGASALYGSDAIAGVVNIILRKSFNGLSVSGEYGQTQRGDGATSHFSGIYGFGDLEADGHNAYIALEYRHQDEILVEHRHGLWNADDPRNWVRLGGIDLTPGVANQSNGGAYGGGLLSNTGVVQNPADNTQFTALNPNCPVSAQTATDANGNATSRCGAYLYHGIQIQPPTENINLTSHYNFKFGGGWQSSTELSLWDSRAEQIGPPNTTVYPTGFVGINANGTVPVLAAGSPFVTMLPANYPGNPYGAPAPLVYQFMDVGNLTTHFSSANFRAIENLQGSAYGWDLNGAFGITYVKLDEIANNYINYPNLQTALNNGTYHIGALAGTNSAAVYNFIAPTENFGASSLLDFANVKAGRDLIQLPGGPLAMAVGAEIYHKALDTRDAPSVTAGNQSGVTGFAIGHQNDAGAFLELDAQVLKQLELNVSGRADHQWTDYGAYGNSVKPHFGFKASPIDIVTVRGTWSEGYRLPTPAEAGVSGTLFGAGNVFDPALCPTGGGAGATNIPGQNFYFPSQCNLNPVNVQTPTHNLSSERSDNWTLGTIFEPTKWLYTSADYFNYRIKNQIWSPFELGGLRAFETYVRGPGTTLPAINALTGASAGNQPTPTGLILYKSFPYVNAAVTTITGFDFEIRLKFDLQEYGRFVADLNATHQFKYEIISAGKRKFELAGTQGPSGVSGDTGNPRNRATLNLTWDKGPAEVSLNMNYVGRFSTNDPSEGQPAPCDGPPVGFSTTYTGPFGALPFPQKNLCYVASWTDFDLYASYRIGKHWTLHGTILNLFDRAPSFDASTYGAPGGFYSTLENAGAIGRFFSGGVRYDF
jgi:iron complex outermembrane receptor protein